MSEMSRLIDRSWTDKQKKKTTHPPIPLCHSSTGIVETLWLPRVEGMVLGRWDEERLYREAGGGLEGDEEDEGRRIQQPTPGLWSMKGACQRNSSCSALGQDPPDCSLS